MKQNKNKTRTEVVESNNVEDSYIRFIALQFLENVEVKSFMLKDTNAFTSSCLKV